MALNSPGVQVQVIDESFYTPAAAGTTPLVFIATSANKVKPSSTTEIAPGTLSSNAGKVYTITSQRDLTDTFGVPLFQTDSSNNPVHGGELNEYGLQAAYSYLGASSKAYVVRADVDLSQLVPTSSEPTGAPVGGTYWVDSDSSSYGISQWDATKKVFVNQIPLIIDNSSTSTFLDLNTSAPISSMGIAGNYAMVVTSDNANQLYFKNKDDIWVVVGSNAEVAFDSLNTASSFASTCWQTSWPVATSTGFNALTTGTVSLNGETISIDASNTPADVAAAINAVSEITFVGAKVVNSNLELYADIRANGSSGQIVLLNGTIAVSKLGFTAGTYSALTLTMASHTQYPDYATAKSPSGSLYLKTTVKNGGANWVVKLYSSNTKSWSTVSAPLYAGTEVATLALDSTGGQNIPAGSLYVGYNYELGNGTSEDSPKLAEYKLYRRSATGATVVSATPSITALATDYYFSIYETVPGSSAYVQSNALTALGGWTIAQLVTAINTSGLTYVSASFVNGVFTLKHRLGGDFKIVNQTNNIMTALGFSTSTPGLYLLEQYDPNGEPNIHDDYKATNWKPLVYEALTTAPTTLPADGQLWYNNVSSDVDIMYHNGTTWVGYRDATAFPTTDPAGPLVKATAPVDGDRSDNGNLVNGELWISTADPERFGQDIYVYDGSASKWVKQDVADQTTPNGWLFADARWATAGSAMHPSTIKALLSSNYVDPDSPDPTLYPRGVRLWNLRRSGMNVKKYVKNHINILANEGLNVRYNNESMEAYNPDRWVTASPNAADGSGSFGRLAQRGFVVTELKALVDTNQSVRDTDVLLFNLIATPGYPEAIQNMIALNNDRGQTAFVVGDTPFRLAANGTDITTWGSNANSALDNNDVGSVSYDEYMAMFYPSGYTNDNVGNNIVVPPSHMMLRTIALSDQKSYQWFAPAGVRRGGIDNATAVGYLKDGEFVRASLPESMRDVLASVKINPIATLPGSGIVNYGNYTRAKAASALDRINVARLVCYLRRQLEILARPYLFEPNDRITRNEIKNAAESLLLELVGQRALYDFIVVCDETNNTAARIDRSELWLDIAIEPVKAVEFIYIPLRIKNTGDIAAGL